MDLLLEETSSIISSSSGSQVAEDTSLTGWFKSLWETIVTFFTTGKIDESTAGYSIIGRILIAVVVFFVFYYLIKGFIALLKRWNRKSKSKDQSAKTTFSFTINILKAVLYIILVVAVFGILGFNLSGLSTIISSAIVAIGLSLQNIISNFASGIIILTGRPFLVGDYIEVNGVEGTVKDISIITTKLVTVDNTVVYVPNSSITSSNMVNDDLMTFRRYNFKFTLSYNSDIKAVKKIVNDVVRNDPHVVKDMPITVEVESFSITSIDFTVRCYVPTAIYWTVIWSLRENIYTALAKYNVEPPSSRMNVQLTNNQSKDVEAELQAAPEAMKKHDINSERQEVEEEIMEAKIKQAAAKAGFRKKSAKKDNKKDAKKDGKK